MRRDAAKLLTLLAKSPEAAPPVGVTRLAARIAFGARLPISAMERKSEGGQAVPDEAQKQMRRGPVAALLLLVGLLLGASAGIAPGLDPSGSSSQLRQAHGGKAAVAARTAPRKAFAEADDAGDPFVLPPPARIVAAAAATHPAGPAGGIETAAPERRTLRAYRARAPPAA